MIFSKEKLIIVLTILIDVIGVGIVIPVMPFFVQSLGASAMTVTSLFAIFSLCSFFSAPLLGAWSDKFGRRPALIVSLASTALGWFVFGAAGSVAMLFLGRIIDGMAAGNFPIAQSYMADISKTAKERTANMGLIGATFGLGFIIGPALGSVLSQISMAFPFYFVGALATLNTVAAYFLLPETNTVLIHNKKISFNPFAPIKIAIKDMVLRTRYTAWFLFSLAIAIQQSIFALFMEHAFSLNASSTGYFYVFIGLILLINQGIFLKKFWLKKFKESQLELWLFLIFAAGFFIMAVPVFFWFIIGTVLMILGQSVLRAVISSRITGFAEPNKKGEVAGIMASLMTLGMVIGPLAVGFIYGLNEHLPFILSGFLLVIAFVVMYGCCGKPSEEKYHHIDVEPVEVL